MEKTNIYCSVSRPFIKWFRLVRKGDYELSCTKTTSTESSTELKQFYPHSWPKRSHLVIFSPHHLVKNQGNQGLRPKKKMITLKTHLKIIEVSIIHQHSEGRSLYLPPDAAPGPLGLSLTTESLSPGHEMKDIARQLLKKDSLVECNEYKFPQKIGKKNTSD